MPVVGTCRGFRDLFDSVPSLMWVARTPADFVYFNKAWLRFRGVELEVETGNAWLSAVHPHDRPELESSLSAWFAGQEAFETEFRILSRDSRYRWLHLTGAPATIGEERGLFVGSALDVSERRDWQATLERVLRRHELILGAAGEGILGLDECGCHTFVNPEAARLLGYRPEELIGQRSHETWHHSRPNHEPSPPEDCLIYAALRDGDVHRVDDDVFWRRDGTPVRVEFISTPIIENGALAGAVVVFRDVTNERRLEALAEAVESMNSLGYVFSAVRHELGNPVNSVKMALSVLRTNLSRFTRQQVEDYLDRSLSELGRVEDLLTSLKSYSLYEDVSAGPLALDRFVEDFARLFGAEYRRQGVDLRVETGLGEETRVHADPRALRQILLNLVANSVEAVGGLEQPLIRISTAKSGGRACLRVRDNGCGMSDDILKNLFKPFHTTKAKGTGLGLVIASKMMTRMEGLIDVDSRPGNGTVISLWFRPADR